MVMGWENEVGETLPTSRKGGETGRPEGKAGRPEGEPEGENSEAKAGRTKSPLWGAGEFSVDGKSPYGEAELAEEGNSELEGEGKAGRPEGEAEGAE